MMTPEAFTTHQQRRRRELWELLGDLPPASEPKVSAVRTEKHTGFTLEHLVLELNTIEPVPAILLVPDEREHPAPGLVYMHWHGSNYDSGKEELLQGRPVLEPMAPVLAKKGIVTLAIDSWCFGERMVYPDDGPRGELDTFKEMLWRGRVLFGMMMFDEWQALTYLAARDEVDASRLGAFGMSMGATKAWWLAALDERVRCCIDLCCLTDYEALLRNRHLGGHGVYYYVPGLLRHFQSHEINELIVPRARLSLNGTNDPLTPPEGVDRIREHLGSLYAMFDRDDACRIERFPCGHEQPPAMRPLIHDWLDRHLLHPTS